MQINSFYAGIENHGTVRRIKAGNKGPLITPMRGFSTTDKTCFDRGAPAGMHMPTDAEALIERVYLAPRCAYSLRRAVLDVTERFGLPGKLVTEPQFDLAPWLTTTLALQTYDAKEHPRN